MKKVSKPSNNIRIRKYRDLLSTGGYGIVLFCIWNIIKIFIYIEDIIPVFAEEYSLDDQTLVLSSIIYLVCANLVAIIVGVISIKEGKKGRVKGIIHQIATSFIALVGLSILVTDTLGFIYYGTFDALLLLLSLFDVVYFLAGLQMAVSSIMLAKLEKQERRNNHEC